MVGFQQFQPPHINVQVHLFLDVGIAGTQSLNLGITEGRFINVLGGAHRAFTGHDLPDEFLLALHKLVEVAVKGVFRYIGINLNLLVFVTLANDAALPLLKVSWSPGTIEMVQGNQFLLNIGASAHFCGTSQQNPHFSSTNLAEQLLFLLLGVGVVDIGNLLGGDAPGNQLVPQIIVHIEGAVVFGSGQVTEGQLGRFLLGGALPDCKDIVGTGADLAGVAVR